MHNAPLHYYSNGTMRRLAGRERFELSRALTLLVFETSTFNRSATFPDCEKRLTRMASAAFVLVTLVRLERTASSSAGKRSNPLSYKVTTE